VIAEELCDKWFIAYVKWGMGRGYAAQEHDVQAWQCYQESLTIWWGLDDQRGIADCLAGFAALARRAGEPKQAVWFYGAVERVREALGATHGRADKVEEDHLVAALRAQLNEALFAATWAEGKATPLEHAISHVLRKADGESRSQ
jgi:hypothetical protein